MVSNKILILVATLICILVSAVMLFQYKNNNDILPIEPTVNDNEIIIGVSGMVVNEKESYKNMKDDDSFNKNIEVDVLIIGGGITGLTTAYYLKDSNLNVCLVEKNYIGMGVTSKTTGKINYLQETIYSDLTSKYSF